MDDKTKLYVFEKKEVLLIFVFLILISTASFLFGVKIGTSYSFSKSGYEAEDHTRIQIKSKEEELVGEIAKNNESSNSKESKLKKIQEISEKSLTKNLDEEFLEEEKKFNQISKPLEEEITTTNETIKEKIVEEELSNTGNNKKDELFGKFTIQIGSYRSVKEAEEFAGGYTVLGYNPIIYDVDLGPKGIWYRVSIGAFETISESKDYIIKNKSLFDGNDYRIVKFE